MYASKQVFQKILSCLCAYLLVFLYLSPIISIVQGDEGCDPIVSTLTGNYEPCNPDWVPQWSPKNPQTIKPFNNEDETSGVAKISFIGGRLPYTWAISGNGFWLDDQYTQTTTVTDTYSTLIYADEDACGSALITVTDACGESGTGYVRSTQGGWGPYSEWIKESAPPCQGGSYAVNREGRCEDNAHYYRAVFWGAKANATDCPKTWTICGEHCCVTFNAFAGFPRVSHAWLMEREWICPE